MKRTPISQPSADLDEMAVRGYLKWKPVPNPRDVFDERGNILIEVKNSWAYRGLVDGIQNRGNFLESHLFIGNESERFQYASGYSNGIEFRKYKQKRPKKEDGTSFKQLDFPF